MTFAAGLAADLLRSQRLFLVKNMLSVDERLVVPEWSETALLPGMRGIDLLCFERQDAKAPQI
ncbi:conserved hypothetical protein [Uncinocarpus reesii 1704]|uniref:Uncharacterized protein n=1 Tax=Uncinocarpus reesii (strain UAMH 1704) TaxID=336963 RepID=C4JUB4_UNCRE|nr:uncharacterized protein UREG_06053 [Uncinocarpus reesii 1704]EEP81211.1 conserved hypothetical protein [Uncinocarpus reesii 1704]